MTDTGRQRRTIREARGLALGVAATMMVWLGAQWLGATYNWNASYAFLFDLAALAAFFWLLVAIWRMWRRLASEK